MQEALNPFIGKTILGTYYPRGGFQYALLDIVKSPESRTRFNMMLGDPSSITEQQIMDVILGEWFALISGVVRDFVRRSFNGLPSARRVIAASPEPLYAQLGNMRDSYREHWMFSIDAEARSIVQMEGGEIKYLTDHLMRDLIPLMQCEMYLKGLLLSGNPNVVEHLNKSYKDLYEELKESEELAPMPPNTQTIRAFRFGGPPDALRDRSILFRGNPEQRALKLIEYGAQPLLLAQELFQEYGRVWRDQMKLRREETLLKAVLSIMRDRAPPEARSDDAARALFVSQYPEGIQEIINLFVRAHTLVGGEISQAYLEANEPFSVAEYVRITPQKPSRGEMDTMINYAREVTHSVNILPEEAASFISLMDGHRRVVVELKNVFGVPERIAESWIEKPERMSNNMIYQIARELVRDRLVQPVALAALTYALDDPKPSQPLQPPLEIFDRAVDVFENIAAKRMYREGPLEDIRARLQFDHLGMSRLILWSSVVAMITAALRVQGAQDVERIAEATTNVFFRPCVYPRKRAFKHPVHPFTTTVARDYLGPRLNSLHDDDVMIVGRHAWYLTPIPVSWQGSKLLKASAIVRKYRESVQPLQDARTSLARLFTTLIELLTKQLPELNDTSWSFKSSLVASCLEILLRHV